MVSINYLQPERLKQAKAGFTTRYVDFDAIASLLTTGIKPTAGDLVLARVEEIGQHQRLDQVNGRKAILFPGDEIILCYGHRYAPDQFEAEVPEDLSPCHLAAAGGIAAQVVAQHIKMDPPTTITPLGLLGDQQANPINLADWALPNPSYIGQRPPVIAVLGTSMNAGKTTTAATLIHGLSRSGLKVGAAKITGTGAGNDIWQMHDAGASLVLDFTSAGFATTYRVSPHQVQEILIRLTSHLAIHGVDVIVLEIADGLFQQETAELAASNVFRQIVDGVIFAAGDALGALAGVDWLRRYQLQVMAVSGLLTTSPLALREATAATGLPVLDLEQLRAEAPHLLARLSEFPMALSV